MSRLICCIFLHSYRFKNLLNYECWVIFHALLSSAYYFSKSTFLKKNLSGTLSSRVSNSLDPDQDRHSVCPDLGPSCLQSLPVAAGKEGFKPMCALDKDQGL